MSKHGVFRYHMQFVDIHTSRIRYQIIDGNPHKPYLVFLHEGLGCIEMWKEFPQRLCERTGCPGLLYDRQGYGQSSPLTKDRDIGYIHAYAREELTVLLDSVLPGRPVLLVGHSDGASIALIYGAAERPRLTGIISEAAHVFVEDVTTAGIRSAYRRYQQRGAPGLVKYHGDKTDTIFRAWAEVWISDWFQAWNIASLLPAVHCPVLSLQGADDAYGTAHQVEAIVSRVSGPAEPLILEDCGHTPHLEKPGPVLAAMQRFITDCRRYPVPE